MRVRFPLIALAAALTGCASMAEAPAQALVGQKLETAIARFGYPSEERAVAGKRLVVWKRTAPAMSGGGQLACELIYEVAAGDVIAGYDMTGDLFACQF